MFRVPKTESTRHLPILASSNDITLKSKQTSSSASLLIINSKFLTDSTNNLLSESNKLSLNH